MGPLWSNRLWGHIMGCKMCQYMHYNLLFFYICAWNFFSFSYSIFYIYRKIKLYKLCVKFECNLAHMCFNIFKVLIIYIHWNKAFKREREREREEREREREKHVILFIYNCPLLLILHYVPSNYMLLLWLHFFLCTVQFLTISKLLLQLDNE